MSVKLNRPISIQLWVLITLVMSLGLTLMAIGFGKTSAWQFSGQLLAEFGKTVVFGSVVTYFLRGFLRLEEEEETAFDAIVHETGIELIYRDRQEAASAMRGAVQDPRTRKVWIAGISLREFFLPGGSLNSVWTEISGRVRRESSQRTPRAERLNVRILLLDPWCSEGDFRDKVESEQSPEASTGGDFRANVELEQSHKGPIDGLAQVARDVPYVVAELLGQLGADNEHIVEARLYQHGSFAFQFITDSFALVQQYTYCLDQAGIPLIEYRRRGSPYGGSPAYEKIQRSYGIVWNHASPAKAGQINVGIGKALRESRLKRIFGSGSDDRELLGKCECAEIKNSKPGDTIDIQAISGRYYAKHLHDESLRRPLGAGAKIRLLIMNPTSRSAILRAVADKSALENIGSELRSWTWMKQKTSELYRDVQDTTSAVETLRVNGCDIDLRLSPADLSCAMFKGPSSMFVEPYTYGRSPGHMAGVRLGGEHNTFEYARGNGSEATLGESILASAFGVLWDSYSMSAKEFDQQGESDRSDCFERELDVLRRQLGKEAQADEITMVILAAGYGVRIAADLERDPALKGKPKALLPVRSVPMIEWLLRGVENIPQIRRVVIVTNDLYIDQFTAWREANPKWHHVRIISDGTKSNEERRGAIGALSFVIAREGIRGNVFVVGGDNFFARGFGDVIKAFLEWQRGLVVVHDEGSLERVAGRLGVVRMDADNRIVEFEEKPKEPKSTLASTLCYALTGSDVRRLEDYVRGNPSADNGGDFIRHLVGNQQEIKGFKYEGDWRDIGTFAEY